jgi:hypothetical protein
MEASSDFVCPAEVKGLDREVFISQNKCRTNPAYFVDILEK